MHITRWRNVNAATQQYRLTMMKQHAELYYRLPVPITQKFPYRWQPRCVDDDNGNRGTVPVARNRYTLSILLWQIKAIKTDNLIILKRKLNLHRQAIRMIAFVLINIIFSYGFLIEEHGISLLIMLIVVWIACILLDVPYCVCTCLYTRSLFLIEENADTDN